MIWTALHSKHWDWVRIMIRIGIFDIWLVERKTIPGPGHRSDGARSEQVARGAAPAVDHLGVRGAAGQCCQQQYYWIKWSPAIDLIYKVSSRSHTLIVIHTRVQHHNQVNQDVLCCSCCEKCTCVLGLEPLLNIRTMLCDNLRPGSRECAD